MTKHFYLEHYSRVQTVQRRRLRAIYFETLRHFSRTVEENRGRVSAFEGTIVVNLDLFHILAENNAIFFNMLTTLL